MSVTKGYYGNNEESIFHILTRAGLPVSATCGILANLQAESGFNPTNLQNSYESTLGYTDKAYTVAVDTGTYKNFATDSAGYGLAQWTFSSRKQKLFLYANHTKKKSIGDLTTQVEFLISEMKKTTSKDYPKGSYLWDVLKSYKETANDAFNAGYLFCKDFEKPADKSAPTTRGNTARNVYWAHYSTTSTSASPVEDKGKKIVEIARRQKGIKYHLGGNTPQEGFDDSGLVYYSYTTAGVPIEDLSASDLYNKYKSTGRHISEANIAPGDLLFFWDAVSRNYRVSIATDKTHHITVNSSDTPTVDEKDIFKRPTNIIRLLSEVQISQSISPDDINNSADVIDYSSLTTLDPYISNVSKNLSRVSADGYDYGYLFDISHNEGGVFRFPIPEFTESAGANWSSIEIRGRSVDVLAYEFTKSRVITINLDLYAGAGLYAGIEGETLEDSVDRLHKDLEFIKSLEYPDYSDAIVRPPATVHLILGASIDIVGVISDVSVEHLKPLDKYNRSVYTKVSFTVTQIASDPPDYKDIRDGSYTLSTTENVDSINSEGSTITRASNTPIYASTR